MFRPSILVVCALFSPLLAQAPSATPATPQPTPTFRAQTELVTLPVVVSDKSGKHLTGLKQSDFVVEENGHRRQIATFEEVTPVTDAIKRKELPHFEFSNYVTLDGRPHRITIIVLDLLNTPFIYQADTRRQVIKYLAEHVPDAGPTALTMLNGRGLHQVHSFTSDPNVLVAALKKIESTQSVQDQIASGAAIDPESSNPLNDPSVGNDPMGEAQQMQEIFLERADAMFGAYKQRVQTLDTLAALEQLAQSYAGIPGRKSLIWATGGIPFLLNDPNSITGIDTTLMDDYRRVWRALNAANISVYPVDAQGLLGPDLSRRGMQAKGPTIPRNNRGGLQAPTPLPVDPRQNAQDSLRAFAAATGGKPCLNQNDLATCFARAEEDSAQYYLLSYYLPDDDRKPGWRKLKVQVTPAHGEIRTRDGFYVGDTPPADSKSAREQLNLAFTSPLEYTSVPLSLSFTGVNPTENGSRKISFKVLFAANGFFIDETNNNAVSLNVDAISVDEKGKAVDIFSRVLNAHLKPESLPSVAKNGVSFSGDVVLPKGRYQLKFVVRDNLAGKIGSVAAPIQVD